MKVKKDLFKPVDIWENPPEIDPMEVLRRTPLLYKKKKSAGTSPAPSL